MRKKSTVRPRVEVTCEDCGVSRRGFLRSVGATLAAGAAGSLVAAPLSVSAAPADKGAAETVVKAFHASLTPEQRKIMCFPFDHKLRSFISNNWNVVDETAGAIEKLYTPDQKEMIRQIFKGVTSEEGHEKFLRQMKDDAGGFEKYTCAVFGEPGTGKYEWVLTGRHLTIRADGDSIEGAAFAGPIFYGHAVEFNERPDHPGNIWWPQARMANEIYKALDGKQQALALLDKAPADDATVVALPRPGDVLPGCPVRDLGKDQKAHLEKTLRSMLTMYRSQDVDEALRYLGENGGMDALALSFYKEEDLGGDGIWDRWMLRGPGFVWYFRGSPHVHAWLSVGKPGDERKARI